MASKKNNVADTAPPEGGFPGFDYLLSAVQAWGTALQLQGNLWNSAWTALRSGDKDHTWSSTLARSLEIQCNLVETLVRRHPMANNAPNWVRLVWAQNAAPPIGFHSRPITGVQSGEEFEETELVPFANSQRSKPITMIAKARKDLSIEIRIKEDTVRPNEPGYYLGFVFKRPTQDAPLLVVLLDVE